MRYFPLLLLCLFCSCGGEDPRGADEVTSLPIQVREPREVAAASDRPEFVAVNGENMAREIAPLLMNLMAKYEVAADKYPLMVEEDRAQEQRAALRRVYNELVQLARRDGFSLEERIPRSLYRTTRALEGLDQVEFRRRFPEVLGDELRKTRLRVEQYGQRRLPSAYEQIRRELLTTLN